MQFLAVFTIAVFFLYLTVVIVEKDDKNVVETCIAFSYLALIIFNGIVMAICEMYRRDYFFILELTFHIPNIIKPFYYNEKGKIARLLGIITFMSRYFWLK